MALLGWVGVATLVGMVRVGVGPGSRVGWGCLSRLTRMATFQSAASVLGLRESKFSYSSLAFTDVHLMGFQIQLWGLIFPELVPGLWDPV